MRGLAQYFIWRFLQRITNFTMDFGVFEKCRIELAIEMVEFDRSWQFNP